MNYFIMPTILSKRKEKSDYIIQKILEYYGFDIDVLYSKRRFREIVEARYICFYFLKKYSENSYTLKKIAQIVGGNDHTTVIHGLRKISDLIKINDPSICNAINAIKIALNIM